MYSISQTLEKPSIFVIDNFTQKRQKTILCEIDSRLSMIIYVVLGSEKENNQYFAVIL